jgi:hypothetical protein
VGRSARSAGRPGEPIFLRIVRANFAALQDEDIRHGVKTLADALEDLQPA